MALIAYPADQELLLGLQELDSTAQRLVARLAKLPEQAALEAAEAERSSLARAVVDQTGSLEDARAELDRTESDVAVVEARIERDQTRLQSSSSMKDIQGLELELAALAKRKGDLEDIELVVMETVEQREGELTAAQARLDELAARVAEVTEYRDAARGALQAESADVAAQRAELASRIPDDLLALYEKQRARYGVGASLLRGGVSVAAGVALTGSDLTAIRAAAPEAVVLCPESNAILVRTAESGL